MGNSKPAQPLDKALGTSITPLPGSALWQRMVALAGLAKLVNLADMAKLGQITLAPPLRGGYLLWAPWFFCAGAAAYFLPPLEPSYWLSLLIILAGFGGLMLARRRTTLMAAWAGFIAGLLIAFGAGFGSAQWRSHVVAAPRLPSLSHVYKGQGMVLKVDKERGRRARYLIAPKQLDRLDEAHLPKRIRISALAGDAEPGQSVRFAAALQAPSGARFAGGYDFARSAWFARLGGSGFAYGHLHKNGGQAEPKPSLKMYMAKLRRAMAVRIRQGLKGQKGAVAAALVTGERSTISEATKSDLRAAGLAHMLAISGLHMGMVAGLVFAAAAMLLALIPAIGGRYDCRKPAALLGLGVAAGYLLLSGASAPTQRAFVMIAMVFLAVLFDRRALSLRTVSLSAFIVAALAPQNVITPGFQMSFAAALALIAFYEWSGSRARLWPASHVSPVLALPVRIGAVLFALALTSLVAGLATGPFAAFYFHRTAVYGLLANIAAMPVFTFVVMPSLLLGTLLDGLGAGAPFFHLAGWGLDGIIAIAHIVAQMPGAVHQVASAPASLLALMAAGLLVLCLVQHKWRLAGAALMLVTGVNWALLSHPDGILLGQGGALRIQIEGQPRLLGFGDFASYDLEQFAGSLGLEPGAVLMMRKAWRSLPCDAGGCLVHLENGDRIALNLELGRLAEDCHLASLVIASRRPTPRNRANCAEGQLISPPRIKEPARYLYLDKKRRTLTAPLRTRLWDAPVKAARSRSRAASAATPGH